MIKCFSQGFVNYVPLNDGLMILTVRDTSAVYLFIYFLDFYLFGNVCTLWPWFCFDFMVSWLVTTTTLTFFASFLTFQSALPVMGDATFQAAVVMVAIRAGRYGQKCHHNINVDTDNYQDKCQIIIYFKFKG